MGVALATFGVALAICGVALVVIFENVQRLIATFWKKRKLHKIVLNIITHDNAQQVSLTQVCILLVRAISLLLKIAICGIIHLIVVIIFTMIVMILLVSEF